MSETYWVFDPVEGKDIPLNVRTNKRGRIEIKRLPAHNFSGGETPRLLEKKAAFIDSAASTFGEKRTENEFPVWKALRRDMPQAAQNFQNPRRSQREARQSYYRSLLGPEILDRAVMEDALRQGRAPPGRVVPVRNRPPKRDVIEELLSGRFGRAKFPWPNNWDRKRNRRGSPPPPL
jgi:hypothetical protein